MSHAGDMADDEISQRTARIVEAEHAAYGAQGAVSGMRRQLVRANWVWGVLAFLVAVGGVGYALRDQVDHFATKEKVEANTAEIERQRQEITEINAVLRGVQDTQKRTLDGVDDVKRILMNRRRP